MLKVAMHWYAFQMFTIRLVCRSGVSTWTTERVSSQYCFRARKAASTFRRSRYFAITGLTFCLLTVWESAGSNFWSFGFPDTRG